jgi:nucleotide-binding universal stress UspA family protein
VLADVSDPVAAGVVQRDRRTDMAASFEQLRPGGIGDLESRRVPQSDRLGEVTMAQSMRYGAVVVGVDGSPGSSAAIKLAATEARFRRTALIAVMAYSGERALGSPGPQPEPAIGTAGDDRLVAEASLRDAVRHALGDQADGVELRPVLGLAGRRIVETAHKVNAQLIVLASRGSISLVIGTVSQYVLHHAPCPVLVVPGAARGA